jgi:hypothetical protein
MRVPRRPLRVGSLVLAALDRPDVLLRVLGRGEPPRVSAR